jgi:methylglyoxal synthase
MNIALMTHDGKKELMVQFCIAYCGILAEHSLIATSATGKLVSDATGLPISLYMGGAQGGAQQIGARIAYNEIDLVLLFADPNTIDPWDDSQTMETLRHCDKHNVPVATNLASAEMLVMGLQRGDLDWREVLHNRPKF